jgi:hypothetical protein
VNNAPVAGNDPSGNQNFNTPRNTPLTIAAPGVLLNDTDPDSPPSRVRVVLATVVQPANGTGSVAVNANGSFTYTPPQNFQGTATFKYRADDGVWRQTTILMSPQSNEATVTITVKQGGRGGGK